MLGPGCATSRPAAQQERNRPGLCRPDLPCWPAAADWHELQASLRG